ncbi:MAG: hypothetical protein R3C26_19670 [Calditrichia bacterium]
MDGHENVSEYNQPDENGPAEMGFHATAQNLNLNRDFSESRIAGNAAHGCNCSTNGCPIFWWIIT